MNRRRHTAGHSPVLDARAPDLEEISEAKPVRPNTKTAHGQKSSGVKVSVAGPPGHLNRRVLVHIIDIRPPCQWPDTHDFQLRVNFRLLVDQYECRIHL